MQLDIKPVVINYVILAQVSITRYGPYMWKLYT